MRTTIKSTVLAAITVCALLSGTASVGAENLAPSARATITQNTAQVGEQKFHYLRTGSGDTTIILLHGWPQSSHEWRHVMPLLADHFTVIAPDLPGIGGSSQPPSDAGAGQSFEKAALARNLHGFIKTLSARRVVLIGHDVGGMVAYAYARLYSKDLAGVGILDVPLPGIAPWNAVKSIPQAWHFNFNAQKPLAERLVAGRQTLYFRQFIDNNALNASAISDRDVAVYAAAYDAPESLSAGFGFYRSFVEDEKFNAAQSERLDLPFLLAAADGSLGGGIVPMEAGLRALGVRNISVTLIPNSGHWIAEENPVATAEAIAKFAAAVH
ncbi:alpha/beta hydrolase [Oxalobacteraceae bacterium OTU3CINTB1]|nr:alpha/beta hydrolase [Oxalobacteraceae bacterium OTU3CINTB1]